MHYGRCAGGECTAQKQAPGTVKWRQKNVVKYLVKYNISHKEITNKKQQAHPEKKNKSSVNFSTKFSVC